MTNPLHEQLREASLGCTPPLADLLRRAADALEVQDGMVPVPIEPTTRMWISGMDETRHEENGEMILLSGEQTCRIYKAMLKAAGESS